MDIAGHSMAPVAVSLPLQGRVARTVCDREGREGM